MDTNNIFTRPEKPFLVVSHFEENGEINIEWCEDLEDVKEHINGYKADFKDFVVDDIIEIGSCRRYLDSEV
ncbi:hypothetical protein [Anaerosacchariphilus polymeriproducens]|uniref:Uncharacterized protein n=1 Tax=Anaerosacchariphilus polymeriproducens TaxID=1812858 RepID=A0A371AQS1_9FIRM|nr:hypothetical protein [Anaerosacchariphilus polymeriproducens]RDU21926.1 hypothetical protein DWV06_15420 [Anaerosacchariphilus polymeriproducens]